PTAASMRPRGIRMRLLPPLVALVAVVIVTPVLADGEGVMDRPRPDYDAKGLPLGAFTLKPALDVGAASDDNVFDTPTARDSDIFYTIRPSFDLASNWSQHRLEISGSLTRYEYQQQSGEDRTDWNIGASGRVDVLRGTYIDGDADYL